MGAPPRFGRAIVPSSTTAPFFSNRPGAEEVQAQGKLGSVCLAATAPGTPPLLLPAGMAKKIPAGWHLLFVLHYTPVGSIQQDRTSIGLVFADRNEVREEAATQLLYDEELVIPAHAAAHRVEKSWRAPADVLLLAMFPHMHLHGKSFRYEAVAPGGDVEVLLDVPHYDFNWQHRYVLAEPKRLPAGTLIRCVAVYDNSADNPANPDPNQTVRTGKQSWDEMFNGYFEWALADEDLTHAQGAGRDCPPRASGFSEVPSDAAGGCGRPLALSAHPPVLPSSREAFRPVRSLLGKG